MLTSSRDRLSATSSRGFSVRLETRLACSRLVARVAREIRLLDQALKATNAQTIVEGYDQDDAALGELS